MAIPSTKDPYVTATYEGRYGSYAVTVYGPSTGAPDPPHALRLVGVPEPRFGEVSRAFGAGLIAHSTDYRFDDPDGVLDGLFGDDFDPADFDVRITGQDGFGGTWTVWTKPMRGELQGSTSPLVTRTAPAGLGTHDRLAALSDEEGHPTTGWTVADVALDLWRAMPGLPAGGPPTGWLAAQTWWDVLVAWPIYHPDALSVSGNTVLADRVRFTGEVAGDAERGTFGKVLDQLRALCEAATLSVYQPTDADPDDPRWEVGPRSRVGQTAFYSRVTPSGAYAAAPDGTVQRLFGDVEADTVVRPLHDLPSHTADRAGAGAGRVQRVGEFRLEGRAQISYGTPEATLGPGEEAVVPITTVLPTSGLRFRVAIPTLFNQAGPVRLELAGPDGTTYYGPDWTTSAQSMGASSVTTADVPVAGPLALVLVGDEADINPDPNEEDYVDQEFGAGTLSFEDDGGDPVTDYVVRVGAPTGEPVELRLLAPLEVYDGSAWSAPAEYSARVSGGVHGTVGAATVAERLCQQGVNLRQMTAEVTGIWGPQSRFFVEGRDNGNARSPWPEPVTLVPTGGEVNLEEGWTLLSLIAVTETPPA